jgi:branched-subunit amino acid ABC-type transport system permease component
MLFNNNWQKSPKRRFLLILGITAFIAILTFGLMVIFWQKMLPNMPQSQKYAFGGVIILYAFLRFSRLLKKEPDEE